MTIEELDAWLKRLATEHPVWFDLAALVPPAIFGALLYLVLLWAAR